MCYEQQKRNSIEKLRRNLSTNFSERKKERKRRKNTKKL